MPPPSGFAHASITKSNSTRGIAPALAKSARTGHPLLEWCAERFLKVAHAAVSRPPDNRK
jgi:hypothetical protein